MATRRWAAEELPDSWTIMRKKSPPKNGRRGSVLLLVVITMSMMSMFAIGATENSRTLINSAATNRSILHARLAAESALQYSHRQLTLDQNWVGSGDWIDLTGARFLITKIVGPPGPDVGFLLQATAGQATMSLQADYQVGETNSPVIDHAVAFLGGSTDFSNVTISGDLLAVDTEGGVMDYDPVSDSWSKRTSGGDPVLESNNNRIDGDLSTTSGNSMPGVSVGGESGSSGPIVNPMWDLDPYLIPNPDTIILHDVTQVRNMVTDKTVVVVNAPGTSVEFKQCDIKGGVVMWSPSDWPQRGPSRNEVSWTHSTFGTAGGGTGTHRYIGMLAPGSKLDSANAANPGNGLFFFHEVGHMNNATINGALWVVNSTGQWNNVDVNYDEGMSSFDFMGMQARYSYVDLIQVAEFHPNVNNGQQISSGP